MVSKSAGLDTTFDVRFMIGESLREIPNRITYTRTFTRFTFGLVNMSCVLTGKLFTDLLKI